MSKNLVWAVAAAVALAASSASAALTHRYTFDVDGSDSSGNGNHGTLVNGAAIDNSTFKEGTGSLILVQSASPYAAVQLPINGFSGAAPPISLAAWVNVNRLPEGPEGFVFGYANTLGVNSPNFQFRVNSNGRPQIGRWDCGGFSSVGGGNANGPSVIQTGWNHIAATIDAANLATVYVNGLSVATGTLTSGPIGAPTTFYIGTMEVGPNNFIRPLEGYVDDARIYNHVLTEGEVRVLAGIPEPASMLLAGLGSLAVVAIRRRWS